MLSADTVPFALWCASRSPSDLPEALWRAVEAMGARTIIAAIVGGVVALSGVPRALPGDWLEAREPLELYL